MKSRAEIRIENLHATVLVALRELSPANIVRNSYIGVSARQILQIDVELADLQQPVNVTGVASEAIRQLQDRLDRQRELEGRQRELLSEILLDGAGIFSKALVAHLVIRPRSACRLD